MEWAVGSRRIAGAPPETIVHDGLSRCPYLPAQTARLPLRLPARWLRPEEFAQRLEAGDRRQGVLLYRPSCPACHACEPIRILVDDFEPNRTQKRIFRRAETILRTEITKPTVTAEKVRLYNRHKVERGLLVGDGLVDAVGYQQFLVETCADTLELTCWLAGRLVGVAVMDRAAGAISAVYCFYDPSCAPLSLGTYSILKQVTLCRAWGLRYLYLGLYVAECRSMSYKARYLPHERLIDGVWRRFERHRADRYHFE